MSTILNFGRDAQGLNAYAPPPSVDNYNATITNGSSTSITVPSNYPFWIVVFSFQPGTNVWVDFSGATAAVPGGTTLAACTAVLNPSARVVDAGTNISIITDNSSADVGISFYAVSNS
jgi:hypothetical protein